MLSINISQNQPDGIATLIDLLSSGTATPKGKENAAGVLMNLALRDASRTIIADNNGIAPLIDLLSSGTATAKAKENATVALSRLLADKLKSDLPSSGTATAAINVPVELVHGDNQTQNGKRPTSSNQV